MKNSQADRSDLKGTAPQNHGELNYKFLEGTECWAPGGKSLTTKEIKDFCCSHSTGRTLSCSDPFSDPFCSVKSDPEFVGKDPQTVLRNP